MHNLSIRKLDSQLYEKLKEKAAKDGISMEEEVRRILFQALNAPDNISSIFEKYFGIDNGLDLEYLLNQRTPHEPMDFS